MPKELRYASRRTKWKARIQALEEDCEEPGSKSEQQLRCVERERGRGAERSSARGRI